MLGAEEGDPLSTWSQASRDLWARLAETNTDLAQRWGARSMAPGEWTVDTVTADLIEAWEELTPMVGEGIELWLELVQRGMRMGRADD